MGKKQYLIDSDDGYLYIIFKRSIIVDEKNRNLESNAIVEFLYPEDAVRQKKHRGKIILCSDNELILQEKMDQMIRRRENKNKQVDEEGLLAEPPAKRLRKTLQDTANAENKKEKTHHEMSVTEFERKDQRKAQIAIEKQTKIAKTAAAKQLLAEVESNAKIQTLDPLRKISCRQDQSSESPNSSKLEFHLGILDIKVHSAIRAAESLVTSLHQVQNDIRGWKQETPTSLIDLTDNVQQPSSTITSNSAFKDVSQIDTMDVVVSSPLSVRSITPVVHEDSDSNVSSCSKGEEKTYGPPKSLVTYDDSSDDEYNISTHVYSDSSTPPRVNVPIPNNDYSAQGQFEAEINVKEVFTTRNGKKKEFTKADVSSSAPRSQTSQKATSTQGFCSGTKETATEGAVQTKDKGGVWTLKYVVLERGKTTELVKGSDIFVKKSCLETLLAGAKNQTGLARMLMDVTFKREALLECSLGGGQANGLGRNPVVERRPALHKGAVETILTFVRKYAEKCHWAPVDNSTVKASLRSKLTEIRKQQQMNTL